MTSLRFVLCLSAALALGSPIISVSAQDTASIKIMCYNTAHGAGGNDGILNIGRIAGIINAYSPDLCGLQEIDSACSRSDYVNQPSEYARQTSMNGVFGRAIWLETGGYGNLILTKRPFTNVRKYPLPGGEARLAAFADVDVATSSGAIVKVTFVVTHFMVGDAASQLRSAQIIDSLAAAVIPANQPAIFCGDLNAQRSSATLTELGTTWTYGSFNFGIDWIMYRPAARWRLVNVSKLTAGDAGIASDHVPVVMELTLLGMATGTNAGNPSFPKIAQPASSVGVFNLRGGRIAQTRAEGIHKANRRISSNVYIRTIPEPR
jgi:endonuclease/exonuclease/phosphatase family metal-dependent hydrolase